MKADRCAQFVSELGVTAHSASDLIENLVRVFKNSKRQVSKIPSKDVNLVNIQLTFQTRRSGQQELHELMKGEKMFWKTSNYQVVWKRCSSF